MTLQNNDGIKRLEYLERFSAVRTAFTDLHFLRQIDRGFISDGYR
jgi:hypothetical protein